MNKFIRVHDVPTGNPVIINSDEIKLVSKSKVYEGASCIHSCIYEDSIPDPFIHVTETPEKIYEMLK